MKKKIFKLIILVVFLFLGTFRVKAIGIPPIATITLKVSAVNNDKKSLESAEYSITKNDINVVKHTSTNRLKEQSSASTDIFDKTLDRSLIETVTFLDSINIPTSVNNDNKWDVSTAQNESVMAWYEDYDNNNLYELYIAQEDGVILSSGFELFSDFTNLTEIEGLDTVDTSNVTNMGAMFAYCFELISLDLSSFDTSKVTSMSDMFKSCTALTTLDLISFDTSKVASMSAMFQQCSALINLDLSNFNTSNVTAMNLMFSSCSKLTSLDLTSFDTSKVIDMYHMFWNNQLLANIYVSELWDTSSVTESNQMFFQADSLSNYSSNYEDATKAHYDEGGYLTYRAKPEVTTTATGLSFVLMPGIYTLKETKTPNGYIKNNSIYNIRIDSVGMIVASKTIDNNTTGSFTFDRALEDSNILILNIKYDKVDNSINNATIETETITKTEEKVDNPSTGVALPIISLTALSGLGFVIYKYSKKKNLFN